MRAEMVRNIFQAADGFVYGFSGIANNDQALLIAGKVLKSRNRHFNCAKKRAHSIVQIFGDAGALSLFGLNNRG